jgi:hypothetical protein
MPGHAGRQFQTHAVFGRASVEGRLEGFAQTFDRARAFGKRNGVGRNAALVGGQSAHSRGPKDDSSGKQWC